MVFAILLLPGAVANVQAQSDWRTEWEKTLAAAKKEGRLVIHAGPGKEAFFAEFDKKYPEIKAVNNVPNDNTLSRPDPDDVVW